MLEYRCWSGQPQSTTTHTQIHTGTYPTHVISLANRSRWGKGLWSFDNRYARLGVSCLQPVGGRCEGGAGAGQTGWQRHKHAFCVGLLVGHLYQFVGRVALNCCVFLCKRATLPHEHNNNHANTGAATVLTKLPLKGHKLLSVKWKDTDSSILCHQTDLQLVSLSLSIARHSLKEAVTIHFTNKTVSPWTNIHTHDMNILCCKLTWERYNVNSKLDVTNSSKQ